MGVCNTQVCGDGSRQGKAQGHVDQLVAKGEASSHHLAPVETAQLLSLTPNPTPLQGGRG